MVAATPPTPTQVERAGLSVREFAQAAGIGVTKCKELLRAGTVRSIKVGSRRVIPRSELAHLLDVGR